jgi:hypothetical protein
MHPDNVAPSPHTTRSAPCLRRRIPPRVAASHACTVPLPRRAPVGHACPQASPPPCPRAAGSRRRREAPSIAHRAYKRHRTAPSCAPARPPSAITATTTSSPFQAASGQFEHTSIALTAQRSFLQLPSLSRPCPSAPKSPLQRHRRRTPPSQPASRSSAPISTAN